MAHTFQIPFSFEFRTVKAHWTEKETRVVGLSWDYGGGWNLAAEPIGDGRKTTVGLSLDDVPGDLWNRCSDAVDKWQRDDAYGGSISDVDSEIQRICSDFRPRFLFMLLQRGAGLRGRSLPADAWQLRDEFLRVAPEVRTLLAFLNRWGHWDDDRYAKVREIVAFQKKIRRALVSRPSKWLADEFGGSSDIEFGFERKSTYPYFSMDTIECKDAIARTVTVDLLRRERFDVCARTDCSQPFRITSKHSRKYCSQYCGHLESVRRGRAKR